jgi:ABC-type transport system substrate-binding protein
VGVKFHDGSTFDAAAVKANFDARLQNDLMSRPLSAVSAVTVEGTRARVSLRQPWPSFPVVLAGQSGLMAAPSFLHASDGDHPVGTGPFVFKSWEKGAKISVEKNPSYRIAGRPYLAGIDFSIIGTNEGRMTALASGQVDLVGQQQHLQ